MDPSISSSISGTRASVVQIAAPPTVRYTVGSRMHKARVAAGKSLAEISTRLGFAHQAQYQEAEAGGNEGLENAASLLARFSVRLRLPTASLFDHAFPPTVGGPGLLSSPDTDDLASPAGAPATRVGARVKAARLQQDLTVDELLRLVTLGGSPADTASAVNLDACGSGDAGAGGSSPLTSAAGYESAAVETSSSLTAGAVSSATTKEPLLMRGGADVQVLSGVAELEAIEEGHHPSFERWASALNNFAAACGIPLFTLVIGL